MTNLIKYFLVLWCLTGKQAPSLSPHLEHNAV